MESTNSSTLYAPRPTSNSSDVLYMMGLFREPPIARHLTLCAFLLLYAAVVCSNALLASVILADRRLRSKPMYVFMAALAAADAAGSTATLPRIAGDVVAASGGIITVAECATQIFFNGLFLRVQSYVLTAMSIDRYVAICHPLRYGAAATSAVAVRALVVICAASALIALGYPLLARTLRLCKPGVMLTPVCDFVLLCMLSCDPLTYHSAFNAFASVMTTVAPLALIAPTYILVLVECRKASTRASQAKAIHTFVTHFFVLLVFFSFHLFLFSFTSIGVLLHLPPDYLSLIVTLYYSLPGLVNPVIYGLRTAEIRRMLFRSVKQRRVAVAKGEISLEH
ncbi:olfactory receptor 56A4-like [Petromyzon marinus]|uniref:olfactory receptor 56A4-like n=1 Tax=Petromyzon marinus TaxID=7757 RepID=UPI003F72C2DF